MRSRTNGHSKGRIAGQPKWNSLTEYKKDGIENEEERLWVGNEVVGVCRSGVRLGGREDARMETKKKERFPAEVTPL